MEWLSGCYMPLDRTRLIWRNVKVIDVANLYCFVFFAHLFNIMLLFQVDILICNEGFRVMMVVPKEEVVIG